MKFLIDECLSPALAALVRARDFHASMHVTWLGMQALEDWMIVRRASEDGFILLTNNAVDFKVLYHREQIHAGLICLNTAPGLMRLEVQKSLFELVLDKLGKEEPINEVVEATLVRSDSVLIERYPLPQGSGMNMAE